jgi:hypothetical protein
MQNLKTVELSAVQERERSTKANITVGGYHLPLAEQFRNHWALLDDSDLDRLFLIPEFGKHTAADSCLLRDIAESALSDSRVRQFLTPPINLQVAANLELLAFTVDPEKSPLVVGDGNHRIIAHFWTHQSVEGVPIFICSHPAVANWGFCPTLASNRF